MVEKGGGGMCHAILRYAKANNNYDKYEKPSYLKYWDENVLCVSEATLRGF